MSTKSMIANRHTVSVHLVVKDAARAITFYEQAFGAKETFRLTDPAGRIGHAELLIGNSTVMLADEYPDFGALSPVTVGGCPIKLHIYVDDADAAVDRAVKAGATLMRPVQDQFYGDRSGMVADPFGYSWFFASPIEVVPPQEMQRRWSAMFESAKG